jgi:RND family efflux transporter MFP subunit
MTLPSFSSSPTTGPADGDEDARGWTARRRSKGRRVLILLGVLGLGSLGIALAVTSARGRPLSSLLDPPESNIRTVKVTKGKLPLSVTGRGDLESAKNVEVVNGVEGQTTIIFLAPEGSNVKKGELICELDGLTLRNNLTDQEIATRQADSNLQNAVKTREVAQIALNEYLEGTFPHELRLAEHELQLAKANLAQAEDRFEWSSGMLLQNLVSPSQVLADQNSKLNCEISFSKSKTKIEVLKNYTRKKMLTELEANVEKARVDELTMRATFEAQRAKLKKLQDQVAKCKLYAPLDGMVVYANERSAMPGMTQPDIQEGSTVRERQRILRLPDVAHMRVNAKIDESQISRIAPGQKATIRVDAYPNTPLRGTVERVRPLAEVNMFNSDVRLYSTMIAIEDPPSMLRPGMTAKVQILVDQAEDVLSVPVRSVLQFQGKDHAFVVTAEGPQLREIELGTTNDDLVEVKSGLREGDRIALDPASLMTEVEKTRAFALGGPRYRDDWEEDKRPKDAAPAEPEPADD